MPRRARVEYPGAIHHVWSRGNNRRTLFHSGRDYGFYLRLLTEVAVKREWNCLSYCLMPNHVHLVVETPRETLGSGMRDLGSRFGSWFNEINETGGGHVLQGRYGSRPVTSDMQFAQLLRYVAANPVRAGLSAGPADWPWSAHRSLLAGRAQIVIPDRLEALLEPWGGNAGRRYVTLFESRGPLAHVDPHVSPWELRPPLAELLAETADAAAVRSARAHGYRLREIAAHLELSEATVSRRARR